MQWDLLRSFEAVARLGTLTAAARALEVSQSTISRHLGKLEEDAGSPLLLRQSPVELTQRGEALLAAIEPMARAAPVVRAVLDDRPELTGQVTVTTVGELVRWVLAGQLASFYQAYPHLQLRLLADNQITSLAAGDADIALRLARPVRGDLFVRKLRSESYGLFVADSLELGAELPWLGLAGSLVGIPEQRWAEKLFAGRPARLLVEDVETLGLAVQAGLGVAILPRVLAARLTGLVEVSPGDVGGRDLGPIPGRDVWLVVHRSRQRLPRVRAVIEWLEAQRGGAPAAHGGSDGDGDSNGDALAQSCDRENPAP